MANGKSAWFVIFFVVVDVVVGDVNDASTSSVGFAVVTLAISLSLFLYLAKRGLISIVDIKSG